MTEHEAPIESQRSEPHFSVMEGEHGYGQAFVYNQPGWVDLARERTSGLKPSETGRSMLVTDQGRFVVIKGYLVDIEQTLDTGSTIVNPLPHTLRTECRIIIGQPWVVGEFTLPPVREIIVDKVAYALPTTPGDRMTNPFDGDVGTIIAPIGKNAAAQPRRTVQTQPAHEEYL